jgi:hypothetical protein
MHCRFFFILLALHVSWLAHAGGIFWTDRGANQLKRMNFDGTSLQTISLSGAVTVPGSNTRGIAVDIVNEQIFWADNGADRLLRANFDGSSSVILHTITGGNSFPADVWLDPVSQLLYWCDQRRRRIQRATFNGNSVTDVITNTGSTGPYFMNMDTVAGKIYWGGFGDGSIYRANLDGSEHELLLTGNNDTRGVGVDREGGMLYWINRNDAKVHRCPLSAFVNGTIPLTHPDVQTLYEGLDTPHGLMLDIPARKVYWADTGTNPGSGSGGSAVSRGDFDGSSPMEILASGSQPWDVDLDRRCRSYGEWRLRCFRKDATTEQTNHDADPESDGIRNVLEYAFNLPPLHHTTAGIPAGSLITGPVAGAQYHALTFRRRIGTSDLTYYVQVSTNLTTWLGTPADPRTTEIETTSLGDDMEEVTVRTLYPLSGIQSHFMRLNVDFTP